MPMRVVLLRILIVTLVVAGISESASPQTGCRFLLDNCGPTGQPPAPPDHQPPTPPDQGYDPASAVRNFYLALSRADGATAAALVVPEKQGKGPFNANNISQFYSSLREPLKILSIERSSNDFVSVKYRFTRANGSSCIGEAKVNTIYTNGRTMIQGISANC